MRTSNLLLFLFVCLSCTNQHKEKHTITVCIQPLGSFEKSLIDSIQKTIHENYGFKVLILPEKKMPQEAFVNVKVPRYKANILLAYLKKNKPDSIDYVMGLTNYDISTTKKDKSGRIKEPASKYADWGVFGLGYCPGPTCMVSTCRIMTTSNKLFLDRFKKVCFHELGHNLGLKHCSSEKCVMQDASETIKTIDKVDLDLCAKCKSQINL